MGKDESDREAEKKTDPQKQTLIPNWWMIVTQISNDMCKQVGYSSSPQEEAESCWQKTESEQIPRDTKQTHRHIYLFIYLLTYLFAYLKGLIVSLL